MKTPRFMLAALALGIAAALCSCSTVPPNATTSVPHGPRKFALSVAVVGSDRPTPQQWEAIRVKLQRQFAAAGFDVVEDVAQADQIISIEFTPDPADPTSGQVVVVGIRPAPTRGYAFSGAGSSTELYSSNYGFGPFYNGGYGSWLYDPYLSGPVYTYIPPTDTPPTHTRPDHPRPGKPGEPPDHPRPGKPGDRPPGDPDHPTQPPDYHAGQPGRRPLPDPNHQPWPRAPDSLPTTSRPESSSPSYSSTPTYSAPASSPSSYSPPISSNSDSSSFSSSTNSSSSFSSPMPSPASGPTDTATHSSFREN